MKRILYALVALALIGCQKTGTCPVLTVEGGQVQGVKADVEGVYVYRGIPYAAPPLGELRWKAPQPVVPWEGVYAADRFGFPSYQGVHYPGGYTTEWGYGEEAPYSEDCLYINVWTNAPGKTDKKLPVAFWVHGGGFVGGWASEPEFDGQDWAAKDVVLVSFNYRLGVFGFLAHPDLSAESPYGVSGNYGMLDQIAALKWVKKNIAQFGGDPDNITIFGQSAGSGSVKTLCASPLAKGLFNKAILMSGGGISENGVYPRAYSLADAEAASKTVLDWAGLTDLKKMRAAGTEMLYSLSGIYGAVTGNRERITIGPVIDNYVSVKTFDEATVANEIADISYMIGYTLDDLRMMKVGITDFCNAREAAGGKTYAYQFVRPLPTDGRDDVLEGAFHSSDLWFVFKSLEHCWRPWTQGDWDLSEVMLTYWTNFAKYGDPNGKGEVRWTPYTKENPEFMIFGLDGADKEVSAMGKPVEN